MKKSLTLLLLLGIYFSSNAVKAQELKVTSGSDLTIKSGTLFYVSGLSLTPSADYTLSNTAITKSASPSLSNTNATINRVYQLSGTPAAFSGSVQINYADSELNGITESALVLNTNNGSTWTSYADNATKDATNNTLITASLSAIAMTELTLSTAAALPLVWQSFTVSKQNNSAVLIWTTSQELNTKNFIVQHSSDGKIWNDLTSIQAAGNKSSTSLYSYNHSNPSNGNNYYRILQLDIDAKYNYSDIKTANFAIENAPVIVNGNLITNGNLAIQVNKATGIALYGMDGKLLFKKTLNVGLQNIDVSNLAKATYLLKADGTFQKIIVQ
jgi:hypothetical protein